MSTPFFVDSIVKVLRALPAMPDHAGAVHATALMALKREGFDVEHEAPVAMPNGRMGRFDLVVRRWGCQAAIEIDARKPRAKSLEKLLLFNGGRIVALRGVAARGSFEGIDTIVSLRVGLLHSTTERDEARRAVGDAVRAPRRGRRVE